MPPSRLRRRMSRWLICRVFAAGIGGGRREFASAGLHPPFRDRVRAWDSDADEYDLDSRVVEDGVERAGNFPSRSRNRNLARQPVSSRSMTRFLTACVTRTAVGWAVAPRIRMRRPADGAPADLRLHHRRPLLPGGLAQVRRRRRLPGLAVGQAPDFRSIARFRRRLDALADLFTQSLHLAMGLGMAKLGRVALDGTKPEAGASKHKACPTRARTTGADRRTPTPSRTPRPPHAPPGSPRRLGRSSQPGNNSRPTPTT